MRIPAFVPVSLVVALAGCGAVVVPGEASSPAAVSESSVNNGTTSCLGWCFTEDGAAPAGYNPWQRDTGNISGVVINGPTIKTSDGSTVTVVIGVDASYTNILWFDIVPGADPAFSYFYGLADTLNDNECSAASITAAYTPPGGSHTVIAPPPGGTPPGGKGDPRTCGGYNVCVNLADLAALRKNWVCQDKPVPVRNPPCKPGTCI